MIIALALVLAGCTSKPNDTYQKYSARTTEVGFDTVITFMAYTESEARFNEFFEIVKEEYLYYNQLYDRYNDYEGINNIKTINDSAGKNPVKVEKPIIDMLLLAKEYTEITEGYFDVSLGAVLDIWHEYREEGELLNAEGKPGRVPSLEELETAKANTGMEFVEIDPEAMTVYINNENTRLDVGAIGKGYATELIAQKLEQAGLKYGIVSGGGNIRTINTKPGDEPWAIGIEKPSVVVKNESLDIFKIPHSTSIVTSGDYQRYYYGPDDVKYSHLINKDTLMPATNFASLSIVTANSGLADILSTAIYMMPYEKGVEFIKNYNLKYPDNTIEAVWIKEGTDEANWTHKDGFAFTMTPGLEPYSKHLSEQ